MTHRFDERSGFWLPEGQPFWTPPSLCSLRPLPGVLAGAGGQETFLKIITELGLEDGLVFCLDAGASDSYPGAGQTWFDLNGNIDFHLGTGSGSDVADPMHHGAAGAGSAEEYFETADNDYFTATAASALLDAWHKDNAKFTVFGWIYVKDQAGTNNEANIIDTTDKVAPSNGIMWGYNLSEQHWLVVRRASGGLVLNHQGSASFTVNAWNALGLAVDEAAGASGSRYYTNGSVQNFTATYSSPGTAGSSPATIWLGGNGKHPENGTRIAMLAAWNGVDFDQATFDALAAATDRFS